jgi:uncharacterized membrane protein
MDETDYIIGEIIYDSTVKEQQNKENYEDVKHLTQDTEKIKEIMIDLNELIEDGGEQLVYAERITEESQETLKGAEIAVHKARESQKKAVILKGTLVSVGIGACFGGPIGGILGSTVHLTIAGAILGGVSIGGFTGSLANYILKNK